MNKFFLITQYIRYLFHARDEHSLHSPFAYTFYTTLIKPQAPDPEHVPIERLRKELKKSTASLLITDYGAGSSIRNSRTRKVASIARHSEKKPALAQLIYRIIRERKPSVILDLGTSLGLTTLYQAMANPAGQVYTFEGCPNTLALAKENFQTLSVRNIEAIEGNIDHTLPETLAKVPSADFVFFDANHRYEPTLRYFSACLEKAHEDSIFVFDDIYWSAEMKKAWEEIKQHPAVGMTFDLFFIGIVFFRKKQPVQHFTLR